MKKFILVGTIILLIPVLLFAGRLKIEINTNVVERFQKLYIKIKAYEGGSLLTNWNGYVKLKADFYRVVFVDEEGKDSEGSIKIFIKNGARTNKLSLWCPEAKENVKIEVEDITGVSDKLSTGFTNIKIVDFTSPYKDKIIINEIMLQTSDDSKFEWIEFYNRTSERISNTFKIKKESETSSTYKAITNLIFVLPPNGYLILCNSLASLNTFFPDVKNTNNVVIIENNNLKSFLSTSGILSLMDSSNRVIDVVYLSDMDSEYNVSCERISPDLPAYPVKYNWGLCRSTKYYYNYGVKGTPGAVNSLYISDVNNPDREVKLDINISKKIISKEGDLPMDINISCSEPLMVRVFIFDSTGREVYRITRGTEIGGESSARFKFYGKDEEGNSLPTGLYFIVAEGVNEDTGKVKRAVKSFVLSGKLK